MTTMFAQCSHLIVVISIQQIFSGYVGICSHLPQEYLF